MDMDDQVAVRRDGNHKHTTKGDNIHMLLIRCCFVVVVVVVVAAAYKVLHAIICF